MTDAEFDVIGIGNAIVDVISHASDDFLIDHGLDKGAMSLIDADAGHRLYERMGPGIESSGGSAANTIACMASLGANCGFIGKVADDLLGEVFSHDIRSLGVAFDNLPLVGGKPTARCLILVTPDAERTMNTYLGASTELYPQDIDPTRIARSKVTYLEGYLWDPPHAKQAFLKAAQAARDAGRKVALSLSDAFCVDRHREDFLELLKGHVDLLFANEEEIKALYRVDEFDAALQQVRGHCEVAALTRGSKGSVVVAGDEVHVVDCEPVSHVMDTTGAGDAFAAGFLWGYTRGLDPARCAHAGGIASAEVISHMGARPEEDLRVLVADRLGVRDGAAR
jgi:sugar/nucleoside kinase (ribokinase family)